jgi:glycosyltransferase involved in cell wall biosynthesis
MERYIGKCLDSLLIPEIDAVEVLVVNDGSKDRSSEIAHGYADRYPQSIKVIDKANGNYGSCINAALPIATGRYVKVLDADDTFDTTAFSEFVRLLPSLSDDVLITPFCIVNEAGEVTQTIDFCHHPKVILDQTLLFTDLFDSEDSNIPNMWMHALAYNKDIFSRFEYHQTEGISFTDTEWAIWPYAYAKTVRFVNAKPIYRYLVGREGQTVAPELYAKQFKNWLTLMSKMVQTAHKMVEDQQAIPFVMSKIIALSYGIYQKAIYASNPAINNQLSSYDTSLKIEWPMLYNILDEKPISIYSNYKLIHIWREQGYPSKIALPTIEKLNIAVRLRLRQIFHAVKFDKIKNLFTVKIIGLWA